MWPSICRNITSSLRGQILNSDCIPQVNLKDSRKQPEKVFEAFIAIKVRLCKEGNLVQITVSSKRQ